MQFLGARERLLRLLQFGCRFLDIGRLVDGRQPTRLGRPIFRQRARQRRPLLIEAVLELLAIELNQHLAGPHTIAHVCDDSTDHAFNLRRDGDFVFSRERADHFHGTVHGILPDQFGLHRQCRLVAAARLSRLGLGAPDAATARRAIGAAPAPMSHEQSIHKRGKPL